MTTATLALLTSIALTAPPNTISVQAFARGDGGVAVEGDYKITVGLYDAADGGVELWTHTYPEVPIAGGVFSLALDNVTPTLFTGGGDVWIGIKIEGDPELPRQKVLSAPVALVAVRALELQCSGCIDTGQLATGAVTAAKLGISCDVGQVLAMTDAGWGCAANTDTEYKTGVGLVLTEDTFALDLDYTDSRYVQSDGDMAVTGGGKFGGGVQIGTDDATCTAEKAGTLRWTGETIEVCGAVDGTPAWKALGAPAVCGNGVQEGSEPCDDGNKVQTDACLNTCVKASCGDNFIQSGVEQCDDGNQTAGDGCDAACKAESTEGCAPGIAFKQEIAPDLWLCAKDNVTGNNNYIEAYSACNEAGGFHMGTVTSMTRRGLPTDAQIAPAMNWAKAQGYDYVVSGQPVRFFSWNYADTPYESTSCGSGGLGYIHTGETTGSGSNWVALTDGNGADFRPWPAANCVEVSYHTLVSLCQNSTADPDAYVFDHRWR